MDKTFLHRLLNSRRCDFDAFHVSLSIVSFGGTNPTNLRVANLWTQTGFPKTLLSHHHFQVGMSLLSSILRRENGLLEELVRHTACRLSFFCV